MKRAVIKVGTAILTNPNGGLDQDFISSLCSQIARCKHKGWHIVLVTSGAIRAGADRLNLKRRPQLIPEKQAAAAVGQVLLANMYNTALSGLGLTGAQVLLTRDDFSDRARYLNARNTLLTLLRFGVVPVINENDTVSVAEIRFGDNDMLAALVGTIVDADIVLLLTDVPGLCKKKPRQGEDAQVIHEISDITQDIEKIASGANEAGGGTGGMASKLEAAKVAQAAGIMLVIAPGRDENIVERVLRNEKVGTKFIPASSRMSHRKRWIAFAVQAKGSIVVNQGAADILIKHNKSLLPVGMVDVVGNFEAGDLVCIKGPAGESLARGFVNYNSDQLRKLIGRKTSEIKQILGYKEFDEVVHRDNLVIGV